MKLLTSPDENSDLSKDKDHKKKLFTKQSKEADPPEGGEEGRRATLREQEVVNCTVPHKEGGEKGKATLRERVIVNYTDSHEGGGDEGKVSLYEQEVV